MNNLVECNFYSTVSMYADDKFLYLKGNDFKTTYEQMQADLFSWCNSNILTKSVENTKAMIFDAKCKNNELYPKLYIDNNIQ